MKYSLTLVVIIGSLSSAFCQKKVSYDRNIIIERKNGTLVSKSNKPLIDSAAISHWPRLKSDIVISNDGKHVAYTIANQPFRDYTLVIQSTTNPWKTEAVGASTGYFTSDSKKYIYIKKDTLCILTIGSALLEKTNNVLAFQLSPLRTWLAWQPKSEPGTLFLENIATRKKLRLSNVESYSFYKSENYLLLKTSTVKGIALQLMSLPEGTIKTIWSSEDTDVQITDYTIDNTEKQIAFILQSPANHGTAHQRENTLWYYKNGMSTATIKVDKQSIGLNLDLTLQGAPRFSDDGQYIFFTLQQKPLPNPPSDAVSVDVWHYRDTFLQSMQLSDLDPKTYSALIRADGNRVIRLTEDFETSVAPPKGNFMVIAKNAMGDRFWLKQQDTNWIVSLNDGSRKLLKTVGPCSFWLSPGGNYLVYFDAGQDNNYFSYNLKTEEVINITAKMQPNNLAYVDQYQLPDTVMPRPVGIAGWLKNDAGLLVHANYDIWQLDLSAKKAPINITYDYGRLHRIKFRLTNDGRHLVVNPNDTLLVFAFNIINKQNGFFRKILGEKANPELLTMGNQVFYLSRNIYCINDIDFSPGMQPLKAKNANIWVVQRQTNTEAPNYFTTLDFKKFRPLSELQPQKSYNWLTAELVNFKQLDSSRGEGILYKPENFDPSRKYPVIFIYYEQLSHRLHQFPTPNFARTNPDVAWFVSHGYLVCTPDIYFVKGRNGKSALNSIEGAARHLSMLPYVNKNKMAIAGFSTSGGFTNYIITHSNFFAAAIDGAGVSDIVSSALQLSSGTSRLFPYDDILWQHLNTAFDESPIMHVDKVTTPLLIFHSKADGAVPWEQAVELFIALRRFGKKCWMLQYDNGNHGLWTRAEDYKDYTIRLTQFLDHYLKDAPSPKWMTQGIPARLKGLEKGYELESSERNP